jgi:hypothetical protein
MTKINVLEKSVKLPGQRSEDQGHDIKWKEDQGHDIQILQWIGV